MSDHARELVLFDFGGVILRTPFELLPDEVTWRGPFGSPGHDELWDRSVDQDDELHERDYWHLRSSELHPDADDPTFGDQAATNLVLPQKWTSGKRANSFFSRNSEVSSIASTPTSPTANASWSPAAR